MQTENTTKDLIVIERTANGIIPKDLSSRDLAFVHLLTKEMVIVKLLKKHIEQIQEKDIEMAKLNKKLNKKVVIDPKYLTTKDAASYIGTDPSFLTKRQGKAFRLGKHFFKPEDESIVRWDILALEEWLTAQQKDTNLPDDKLASLLKRR